jgi:hypothetical protein
MKMAREACSDVICQVIKTKNKTSTTAVNKMNLLGDLIFDEDPVLRNELVQTWDELVAHNTLTMKLCCIVAPVNDKSPL